MIRERARIARRAFLPFLLASMGGILADVPPASAGSAPSRPVAKAPEPPASRPAAEPAVPEGDPSSRNVVARARMNECGHQWSNMKRAGTASGTFRDFYRGCNAQK